MLKRILFVICLINAVYSAETKFVTLTDNINSVTSGNEINAITPSNVLKTASCDTELEISINNDCGKSDRSDNEIFSHLEMESVESVESINEDLTKNLNINEIIRQKDQLQNNMKTSFQKIKEAIKLNEESLDLCKTSKFERRRQEVMAIQKLNQLSTNDKKAKENIMYTKFSDLCRNFINEAFITGTVDLRGKNAIHETQSATLCVFFGHDLGKIFLDNILDSSRVKLEDYQCTPQFTDVLRAMNTVHRKFIKTSEKYKKIMLKRKYLEK